MFVDNINRVKVFVKYFGNTYWNYRSFDPRVEWLSEVWDFLSDWGVALVDDADNCDVILYLVGFDCRLGREDIVLGVPGLICYGRDRLLFVDRRLDFCFWDIGRLLLEFPYLYVMSWGKYRDMESYCFPEVTGGVRFARESIGYNMPDRSKWWLVGNFVFGYDDVSRIYDRILVGPCLFYGSAALPNEVGNLGLSRYWDVAFSGSGGDWGFGHRAKLVDALKSCGGLKVFLRDSREGIVVRDDVGWVGDFNYLELLCRSRVFVSAWGWSETSTREFAAVMNGCMVIKPETESYIEQWFEADYVQCSADYHDLANVLDCVLSGYDQDILVERAKVWRDRFNNRTRDLAIRMCGIFNQVMNNI